MKYLKHFLLLTLVLLPLTSYGADQCESVLGYFLKQVYFSQEIKPVSISYVDINGYAKQKIIGDIELGQIDDAKLAQIIETADTCAVVQKPYYLENTGYRFSQDQKNLLISKVIALQKPFPFIREMLEEQKTIGGLTLSCYALAGTHFNRVKGILPMPDELFGKKMIGYIASDFNAIDEKITQCKGVITSPHDGFDVNGLFVEELDNLSTDLKEIKVHQVEIQAEAMEQKAQVDEKIKIDTEREYKAEHPSLLVSILIWISKVNGVGGLIAIVIGMAGFVKSDKRFKTGRKNNEADAKWAIPLTILGLSMYVLSYLVGHLASYLQFG